MGKNKKWGSARGEDEKAKRLAQTIAGLWDNERALHAAKTRCVSRGEFSEKELREMEALYGAPIVRPARKAGAQ